MYNLATYSYMSRYTDKKNVLRIHSYAVASFFCSLYTFIYACPAQKMMIMTMTIIMMMTRKQDAEPGDQGFPLSVREGINKGAIT